MKKVLCLSLSLIIIICSVFAVDLSAYAVNSKSSDINTLYINPFLKDDKEEILEKLNELSEKRGQEAHSVSTYSSLRFASYPTTEQAADKLRDAMVSRKETITVKFLSGEYSTTKQAVLAVLNRAIDQSNSISSQDGDYLNWHIAGAGYNATTSEVDSKVLYTVTYSVLYLTTALQEERVTYKIKEINKKLNLAGKSDYIKALEIHDTVCDLIRYDYDYVYDLQITGEEKLIKHSAYGGLFSGLAVCQSYATLYYRLCYENGLKSRVVTSIDHAWNIVNIYGKNYFVDCTWDDGYYDEPYDENGDYWADMYDYYYFLYGSEDEGSKGHNLEEQYNKPSFTNAYPIEKHGLIEDDCPHEASQNVAPTDTYCDSGFTGKIYCRVCLYPLGTYDILENSEHSYISEVIAPTCTTKGYTHHKCEFCSYSYDDARIAATGHNYKNRISPATLNNNGKLTPICTKCKAYKKAITVYSVKTISLSSASYTYNGKARMPAVTVKDSKGKTLKKNTDYTVTYQSGRTKVGKYKVTIKLKGNYSGTKNLYFTIKPPTTSVTSVSPTKKAFTVRWKKKTTQVTGYQVQYSSKSNFSTYKLLKITKNSTTSKKITGLPSKKKYYVRVRTYKTVGKTTYYSNWSSKKSVVTR